MKVGFDWDGTISSHISEFRILSQVFEDIVVITLNEEITCNIAASTLAVAREKISQVIICPEDRVGDYYQWKAEMAVQEAVEMFFDDDIAVVDAVRAVKIPCILVGEVN